MPSVRSGATAPSAFAFVTEIRWIASIQRNLASPNRRIPLIRRKIMLACISALVACFPKIKARINIITADAIERTNIIVSLDAIIRTLRWNRLPIGAIAEATSTNKSPTFKPEKFLPITMSAPSTTRTAPMICSRENTSPRNTLKKGTKRKPPKVQ